MNTLGWLAVGGVAILLVLATAIASRRRRPGRRPHAPSGGGTFRSRVAALDTRSFETRVADGFRAQGYQPATTARGSAGELLFRRDRETTLVDCRHWRQTKVGADAIVAVQRSMQARGAASGFAITSGRFSREAAVQAGLGNIRLIEGPALENLFARAERKPPAPR